MNYQTNTLRLSEVANAMSITVEELHKLLPTLGITPQGNSLSSDTVTQLSKALEDKTKQHIQWAQDGLAKSVEDYHLILDTSAIMMPQFATFVSNIRPLLEQAGKHLIVPNSVLEEMKRKEVSDPEKRSLIFAAAQELYALQQDKLLCIYGDNRASFGDNDLLSLAIRLRLNINPLFITHDRNLTQDLLDLNNQRSVKGNQVRVSKISRYGYLSRRYNPDASISHSRSKSVSIAPLPEVSLVLECNDLIGSPESSTTGQTVHGISNSYTLGELLGSGGEGEVYRLGNGSVAKIFFPKNRTRGRHDKLSLMLQQGNPHPSICWPEELLLDEAGQFLGYRMAEANGQALQRCLFSRSSIERNFPTWSKTEMVQLCVTILEAVTALHRKGILIGDINGLNIMVVSSTQVHFVDTDSYQIGGYPCPVYTSRFYAPELQGKNPSTYLRTFGNESFALASLLFMLMLPGKSPYAQQDSDSIEDGIAQMNFPYPCGEQSGNQIPLGDWRYYWSHLPRFIKEYFHGTFQKGGSYSTESTRLSVTKWHSAFSHYLKLLETGRYQENDPQSALIFPTSLKKSDSPSAQPYLTTHCIDCGEEFIITEGDRLHFESKGLSLPRRCPKCRERRKLEKLLSNAS